MNEHLNYRKTVLDVISPSFCAAKWLNATIWLNSGGTTSCHHPPKQQIPLDELKDNPTAIHNTSHKKKMREMMLNGIRPPECEYCWKIEDMGKDHVSDRSYKSMIHSNEDIQRISKEPFDNNVNLRTLEISFSRACNLACSYCNADYSTTWAKDILKNGPYTDLETYGASIFGSDGSSEDLFDNEENNPYIKAFWDWWNNGLKESLKEIRITGGEPTMSPQTWKLIDYLIEEKINMRFAINSNLMGKPEIIDKIIEKSKGLKDFHLYTSMEATGEQAAYIRDGANYDVWLSNLTRFMEEGKWSETHIMMTINALCLFSITDFMDDMLKLKERFNGYPYIGLNILRFPSFQSSLSLPYDIRKERRDHLEEWYIKNKNKLHLFEQNNIERLVDYLTDVDKPHAKATEDKTLLWNDFKKFYSQYDLRRNKSIYVFPKSLTNLL
jgi:organic radical activating enzyme